MSTPARPLRRTTIALAALALLLTACSNASTGDGQTVAEDVDLARIAADLEPYQSPPTTIKQTEPLTSVPEKKSVAFIICADPTCAVLDDYVKEATGALGWDYTSISTSSTDYGAAVQQAIDLGVDYIGGTGTDIASFRPQMDAMKKAGIPYFSCYSTDVPGGEENGVYASCTDTSGAEEMGSVVADWTINDAEGKVNALVVDVPAFPGLKILGDEIRSSIESECSSCVTHSLGLTIDDVATGGAPNAIVSYLQSNPDVNYVELTFGGFETGLGAALASAGLSDRVTVVGTQAQLPQLQSLIKGESAVWLALPQETAMWVMVDQMARVATNQWSLENERANSPLPVYVIDSVDEAEELLNTENGWPGPEGFKQQYKTLWGV